MRPEALTMGRVSVDAYPEQVGVRLADARSFRKLLGGFGDAFGGVCHELLAGSELERTLSSAKAARALVSSPLGCADDMPTSVELEALLCAA